MSVAGLREEGPFEKIVKSGEKFFTLTPSTVHENCEGSALRHKITKEFFIKMLLFFLVYIHIFGYIFLLYEI